MHCQCQYQPFRRLSSLDEVHHTKPRHGFLQTKYLPVEKDDREGLVPGVPEELGGEVVADGVGAPPTG